MPATMRAARMHAVGGPMSIDTIPVPKPGSTDVLVEVKACGMVPNLGNVLANWTKWFPHLPLPKLPAIFGLDPAGVVVEVGEQVIEVKPGERVYVNPLRSCGACQMCRAGERTRCRYFTFNGYFGFGPDAQKIYDLYPYGGFCEFMTAPQYALVKLPDNVSFEQAARFGYLGTSYGAMKKANAIAGQSMLVDGISGTLGLGAALLGLAMGITRILGTGRNRELLDRVKALAPERIEVHALGRRRRPRNGPRSSTHGDGVDFMISALGPGAPARTMLDSLEGGSARRPRRQCRRRRRAGARRHALADGRADPADRLELVHRRAGPGDGGTGASAGCSISPCSSISGFRSRRSITPFPACRTATAGSATTSSCRDPLQRVGWAKSPARGGPASGPGTTISPASALSRQLPETCGSRRDYADPHVVKAFL